MSSLLERIKELRSDPYCASTYLGNEHVGSFLREVEEALGAVSRITPEQVVSVLRKHQLDEPSGGTAAVAWCNCSCGYQARIREGTRDYAKSLAIAHQALMILSLYRGVQQPNGDDDE